jgi:S1-C subfamily serine protease
MSGSDDWSFPESLQPTVRELDFDLDRALDAMVALRAEIPGDAFTAQTLGTERTGNGVVIREEGVVLTIGYLITEASAIWLTTNQGVVVPGFPLAYDQASGFGLVRALGRLGAPAIELGSSLAVQPGDRVFTIGHGGRRHALQAEVVARREFAGYWEYLLERAIFTAPAHPAWSGAALLGEDGRLIGIGSLLVQEDADDRKSQGNMIVPIEELTPILDDLLATGASRRPPRPWLGMYTGESEGRLFVGGLASGGPAEQAGIHQGDTVMAVGTTRVTTLAEFLRAVWTVGPAGAVVPLSIGRDGDVLRIEVRSVDRSQLLKRPTLQ